MLGLFLASPPVDDVFDYHDRVPRFLYVLDDDYQGFVFLSILFQPRIVVLVLPVTRRSRQRFHQQSLRRKLCSI